jgi:hypothetical protein
LFFLWVSDEVDIALYISHVIVTGKAGGADQAAGERDLHAWLMDAKLHLVVVVANGRIC